MTVEEMSNAVPEPVETAPSGAQDASGVAVEQISNPAVPAQAEPNEPEDLQEEPQGEYVLRSVMEAELADREKKLQSAKDREISELKKLLVPGQQPPQNQQPVSEGGKQEYTEAGLQRLIASDAPYTEIARYQHEWGLADQRAELQKFQQQTSQQQQQQVQLSEAQTQYESQFMALANATESPLSDEQLSRAKHIALDSVQNGMPTITPLQAIAQAQFGDEATLLRMASAQLAAGAAQHAATQRTPATVPGGGRNSVPTAQGQQATFNGQSRGSFHDWH